MFDAFLELDLPGLLRPDVSLLEIFVRGTLIYLGLFVLLRWLRRPTGQLGIADVLLITLLADASQNAMSGPYESVSSGLWLILTIMFWDQVIDRMSHRFPGLARWTQPAPVELIADGKVREENLRRHHISRDELRAHLRQHGLDDFVAVRRCYLENTGHISVLKRDTETP